MAAGQCPLRAKSRQLLSQRVVELIFRARFSTALPAACPIYVVFLTTIAFAIYFPSVVLWDCSTSGLSDLCRFSDYDRIRDLFPGSRVVVAEAGSAGFGRLFPQSGRPRLHLPAIAKSQRVKASRNIERPADPEAHGVIPIIARGSVAEGRADEIRPAAPGAAADDAGGAISTRPR